MTPDVASVFLESQTKMTLGTLLRDGSIHLATMNYVMFEDRVAVLTKTKSQKAVNARRHSGASCLVESGDDYRTLRGVAISGQLEIVEDRAVLVELGIRLRRKLYGAYDDTDRPTIDLSIDKRVGLLMVAERIVSWDHSKVPLPPAHGGPG